jgi:hypothetical protein
MGIVILLYGLLEENNKYKYKYSGFVLSVKCLCSSYVKGKKGKVVAVLN